MGKIILASSSPRRADIMRKAKYKFRVIPSPYQEIHTTTDFSYAYIENLAYQKANAVLPLADEPSLIIGADTLVVLDNKILGKPKDESDAISMLQSLSGKTHIVVTAIVVINSQTGEVRKRSTTSHVTFNRLNDFMILDYVQDSEPYDKAGSYGIQELPVGFVKSYEGSLENIIGMCPKALAELL